MSRRRKPGKGLDVVQRLEQRVAEGDYYEALQLYKTSYSRFKAQGKVEDAEELLATGAIAMSQEKELNAATELGLLLVTSFEEHGRECDVKRLEQLKRVAASMTPGVEMFEFLKSAIRWTKQSQEEGALELRLIMAQAMLATGRHGEAARYLAVSGRPDEYVSLVKQWASKGYPGERDLFLCRAVLHTLSCRRVNDAGEVLQKGTAALSEGVDGNGRDETLDSPLCHFTSFVVELCKAVSEAGSPSGQMVMTFRALHNAYEPSLKRDPNLEEMVNRIGQVHFGIKQQQPGGFMGMLEQLMGGI